MMKKITGVRTLSVLALGGIVLWGAKSLAGGEIIVQHKAVCRATLGTGEVRNTPEGTGDIALVTQTETSHNVWVPDAGEKVYSAGYNTDNCTFSCREGYERNGSNACEEVVTKYPGCDTPDITIGSYTIAACNVGAAIAGTTASSYGDHFQRGNNYGFNAQPGSTVVSGALEQLVDATGYGPNTASGYYTSGTFIRTNSSSTRYDWSTTQNDNLRGNTGSEIERQGPCASGYHLPTNLEWQGVIDAAYVEGVFSGTKNGNNYNWNSTGMNELMAFLKMPLAGNHNRESGALNYQGGYAGYWASTPNGSGAFGLTFISFTITPQNMSNRSYGFSVRCFQNSI